MCNDSESITKKVKDQWDNHKNIKERLNGWLDACKEGKGKIRKSKKQFHQWYPLRVYVSVGKAKSNTAVFSLRFFGQEVAELVVTDTVTLKLNVKHIKNKNNNCYFKDFPLTENSYPWNGKEAKMFRQFFKDFAANSRGKPNVRIEEHRIESKFIEEMLKGGGKFGGCGLKIQPITLGDCPLQFPVPFSANTGEPVDKTGHIDILARRKGKDNKVKLSVWELKKPKAYGKAAAQAYIYALQLLYILRSERGNEWYELFGFNRPVPKSLEIEAVVAIDRKHKDKFDKEKANLGKNSLINGDNIKLCAAYYEEIAGGIILSKDSFREDQ
jgi:hypothetical protein